MLLNLYQDLRVHKKLSLQEQNKLKNHQFKKISFLIKFITQENNKKQIFFIKKVNYQNQKIQDKCYHKKIQKLRLLKQF